MRMEKSMTEGREWKAILLFTLPLMAGNLLQQLYNTVDGIIVGNLVGEDALASVGTCTPLTLFFIAIAVGMSTGASIVISQLYGAGRLEEMRKNVSTSIILLFGIGVVCMLLGIVGAKWLLKTVLGVQDYLLADALIYFRIYSVGLLFQFIYNIAAAVLRSLGDSRATLYFLLVSSVCNVLLALAAVLLLHWNVMGVAVATVVSQFLCATVSMIYMFRTHKNLRFAKGQFRFHKEKVGLILKLAVPTTVQQCVVSMNHMAIQRVVNAFDITAGYTAGLRVVNFIAIPCQSFRLGMATFSAQNLGARKMDRVKRGLWQTLVMATISVVVISAIVLLFTRQLVGLFGVTGESMEIGVLYLKFVAWGFIMFSWYMCINGVLVGAGDVMYTMFNTVSGLVIRTVITYILAFLTPVGYVSIWVVLLISWVYNLALAALRYRFGPWRKKVDVAPEEATALPG